MRHVPRSPVALCAIIIGLALPMAAQSAEPPPCKQIKEACQSAGFVTGDAKLGYGLWADCVDPIMRGSGQPRKADKPLPVVSPEVVAACRQLNPNFGMGKKGQPPK